MKNALTDLLGIRHPIISAAMGPDMSGPELVAAVSNAGGFGMFQGQFEPPHLYRESLRRIRHLTAKPFAANLVLEFPVEEHLDICIAEKVPAISFFWGDPSPYIEHIHRAGILVLHQVGSIEDAKKSADAGSDVIIAQGTEAGGHVIGNVSTLCIVPQIVDAVSPTPVAASGGIMDARGVAAVMCLGARAAVLGTRFLLSSESFAHPGYKQKLVEATSENTVCTKLFGHGWPDGLVRTLRTAFVEEWLGNESRGQQSRPDEPVVGYSHIGGRNSPILRFMGMPPNATSEGDLNLRSLLAGQGVGMGIEIKPAAEIVVELCRGLEHVLETTRHIANA